MKFTLWHVSASCVSLSPSAPVQAAPTAPEVESWRSDCGEIEMNDASPLSDAGSYAGKSRRSTDGCYSIRHGKESLLWDAGWPVTVRGAPIDAQPISPTLAVDLPTQLARIGIRPDDIGRSAISHYHFDHVGQAASFPKATSSIGARDWAASHRGTIPFADPHSLAPWF
ncbi:hypothetical protein OY671_009922, partial [Metschnikowia pulcherrima]